MKVLIACECRQVVKWQSGLLARSTRAKEQGDSQKQDISGHCKSDGGAMGIK